MRTTIASLEKTIADLQSRLDTKEQTIRSIKNFLGKDEFSSYNQPERSLEEKILELVLYKRQTEGSQSLAIRILGDELNTYKNLIRVVLKDPSLEYHTLTNEEKYHLTEYRRKNPPNSSAIKMM